MDTQTLRIPRQHPRRPRRPSRSGPGRAWTALLLAGLVGVWGCGDDPVAGGDDGDGDGGGNGNRPPVAVAGPDLTVSAGLTVTLDASGSTDPDGDALSVTWSLAAPAGSAAALDDASSLTPSFTPDVEGSYVATATVSDGTATTDDDVTITAQDNTASAEIPAAAGGAVTSTDGLLTLSVPAGALDADTEIRVTRVLASQLPASADGVPGLTAVYDMQPSGLTFSTPAEVTFTVDGAFSQGADGQEATAVILLSESEGEVDPLTDITLVPDETIPGRGVAAGGLGHFSHVFVTRPQGLTFYLSAPATGPTVDQIEEDWANYSESEILLGVTALGVEGAPFFIDRVTQEDLHTGVLDVEPEYDAILNEGSNGYRAENRYICREPGAGKIRARIRVDATYADGDSAVVSVQMAQDVTCSAQVQGQFTAASLPVNLASEPGRSNVFFGGAEPRLLEVGSGQVGTVLARHFQGPDDVDWGNRMEDGVWLIHTEQGRPLSGDPTQDTVIRIHSYDQVRDTYQPTPTRTLIADWQGNLGTMDYQGGGTFADRTRTLWPNLPPSAQRQDRLIQVWGDVTGLILGVAVEGNGDAAVNNSRIHMWDEQAGAFVDLGGGIFTDFRDAPYRHELDLECAANGDGTYTCVFSAGSPNPGGVGTGDGYFVIFHVDPQDRSAYRMWRFIGGDARVGGSIHPSTDGQARIVSVVNQATLEVELYRVAGGEVTQNEVLGIPLPVWEQCPRPTDMVYNGAGPDAWVVACGPGDTAEAGLLVVRNLRGVVEGY